MELTVIAAGRGKGDKAAALAEVYAQRATALGRSAHLGPLTIREIDDRALPDTPASARTEMAERLAGALTAGNSGLADTAVIFCDRRGKDLTSEALAQKLAQWRDEGRRRCAFLIGGADGYETSSLPRPAFTLAFGTATWPHLLLRAMVCEQLYRSVTILSNHPYHRSS